MMSHDEDFPASARGGSPAGGGDINPLFHVGSVGEQVSGEMSLLETPPHTLAVSTVE